MHLFTPLTLFLDLVLTFRKRKMLERFQFKVDWKRKMPRLI